MAKQPQRQIDRLVYLATTGGSKIGTARMILRPLRLGRAKLATWLRTQAARLDFVFDANPQGTVAAKINHGRWVVQCPFCLGAEEADPAEPIFFCLSCGNVENGSHVMTVVFPKQQTEIETLLVKRPIANRNWVPGESLAFLRSENREHGV